MSITVRTQTAEVPFRSPFACFLGLRSWLGAEHVSLLESLSGPARDVRSSLLAFDPLFRLSVHGTEVRLEAGGPAREPLAESLRRHLSAAGLVTFAPGSAVATLKDVRDAWALLRTVRDGFTVDSRADGFSFGYFACFGYDVAGAIEHLPRTIPDDEPQPEIAVVVYRMLLRFDLADKKASLICNDADLFGQGVQAAEVTKLIASLPALTELEKEPVPAVPAPRSVRDTMEKSAFLEKVDKALGYIRIGDIYQVQVGHAVLVESVADPLDIYRRLRARNPSPYMYVAPFGSFTLVGASPESFIRIENGRISMRPIAGTIRRGSTPEEDEALAKQLLSDEKELAEHLMLVDLCRNDIGRVCVPGSLEADELIILERYSHVHHLVSNVVGNLSPEQDAFDAIAATFPAGTMTGAPKIRAMEIIEELELSRRGAYAGAVGLIDFGGDVNMALCIRTITCQGQRFSLRASAGVVADSKPENEWRETLQKLAAPYWAVTGQEIA
jgi:anthranilate synthase component 1